MILKIHKWSKTPFRGFFIVYIMVGVCSIVFQRGVWRLNADHYDQILRLSTVFAEYPYVLSIFLCVFRNSLTDLIIPFFMVFSFLYLLFSIGKSTAITCTTIFYLFYDNFSQISANTIVSPDEPVFKAAFLLWFSIHRIKICTGKYKSLILFIVLGTLIISAPPSMISLVITSLLYSILFRSKDLINEMRMNIAT